MTTKLSRTVAGLALLLIASPAFAGEPQAEPKAPRIEVAFVLDTTGSMSGLIEGAKRKIWSIVNEIARAEPRPEVRLALVGYRDRGDDYITRVFDLTDDIDNVYAHLQEFQANGGGDTPESVNQALDEAVHKVSWSPSRDVLKILFLVGDAPPHMDYEGERQYPEIARKAVERDLIINTVQCGGQSETTPVWQEIARRAEGTFVAIGQTGDMEVVATPMDARLTELNAALGSTLIAYGDAPSQLKVQRKQSLAEAAPAAVAADRMAYNVAEKKVVQGKGDLVHDLEAEEVSLEKLEDSELPKELQGKSLEEKKALIATKAAEREKLQKEIAELVRQRDEYLKAERAKLESKPDAFDEEITEMLRTQAARKEIRYPEGDKP